MNNPTRERKGLPSKILSKCCFFEGTAKTLKKKVVFCVGNNKENAYKKKQKKHTKNVKMQMSFLLKEKNPCKQIVGMPFS